MCINDAGVAGHMLCLPGPKVAGECVTEPGSGGGPMSERRSGETESKSELPLLRGTSREPEAGGAAAKSRAV